MYVQRSNSNNVSMAFIFFSCMYLRKISYKLIFRALTSKLVYILDIVFFKIINTSNDRISADLLPIHLTAW